MSVKRLRAEADSHRSSQAALLNLARCALASITQRSTGAEVPSSPNNQIVEMMTLEKRAMLHAKTPSCFWRLTEW